MAVLRVLLVDDDHELASVLLEYFSLHDVQLFHAVDGVGARAFLQEQSCDVLLLDVMLPGEDGFSLLPEFARAAPVIMLTARGESDDRVRGLELGAKDYLPKPFNPKELLLRMRSVTGNRESTVAKSAFAATINVGALCIFPEQMRATLLGTELVLTSFEFRLLVLLGKSAGTAVTRESLAVSLGMGADYDPSVDRSLDVHVSNLRQKLEALSLSVGEAGSKTPWKWVRTVRGVGYMLTRPAS
jgi:DNA-binding response OmpR family regulator